MTIPSVLKVQGDILTTRGKGREGISNGDMTNHYNPCSSLDDNIVGEDEPYNIQNLIIGAENIPAEHRNKLMQE